LDNLKKHVQYTHRKGSVIDRLLNGGVDFGPVGLGGKQLDIPYI
jgi:hypothetical protein